METVEVQCPYCAASVEVAVEQDLAGAMVIDCEVCCRPWQVVVAWRRGRPQLSAARASD